MTKISLLKGVGKGVSVLQRIVEETIPGVLMGILTLIVAADVLMRYVFNRPIRGAAELALICFIWLVYLGAAQAARRGRHIAIDMVYANLPPRGRAAMDIFVEIFTLIILGTVFFVAVNYLQSARFMTSSTTGISKAFITAAVPVSYGLMCLYAFVFLYKAIVGVISGNYVRHFDDPDQELYERLETSEIRRIDLELKGEGDSK